MQKIFSLSLNIQNLSSDWVFIDKKKIKRGISVRIITVHLPQDYIDALDQLISEKKYRCRGDTVRTAIRDFLIQEFRGMEFFQRSDCDHRSVPL